MNCINIWAGSFVVVTTVQKAKGKNRGTGVCREFFIPHPYWASRLSRGQEGEDGLTSPNLHASLHSVFGMQKEYIAPHKSMSCQICSFLYTPVLCPQRRAGPCSRMSPSPCCRVLGLSCPRFSLCTREWCGELL